MSSPPTLAEIESAAATLSPPQQRELVLFLARCLRDGDDPAVPPPRQFSREQLDEWIALDEAGMRRFNGEE